MILSAGLLAWKSVAGPVSSCEMCPNFCVTASMCSHVHINQFLISQKSISFPGTWLSGGCSKSNTDDVCIDITWPNL